MTHQWLSRIPLVSWLTLAWLVLALACGPAATPVPEATATAPPQPATESPALAEAEEPVPAPVSVPVQQNAPPPVPMEAPTATLAPTPTPEPTSTPTAVPTPTPEPTLAPTPEPTATPGADGLSPTIACHGLTKTGGNAQPRPPVDTGDHNNQQSQRKQIPKEADSRSHSNASPYGHIAWKEPLELLKFAYTARTARPTPRYTPTSKG